MYKCKHAYTVNIQSIYPRGCVGNIVVIDTEIVIIGLCLNKFCPSLLHSLSQKCHWERYESIYSLFRYGLNNRVNLIF